MISITRIVDNWDFLLSVIWDFGKLHENYINFKYLMLNGLSWKQLIFILWVYIRKYPLKSWRITNLEALWYKLMRWYLWAWKLSLTITLMQHNATLPKAKEEGGREWDGCMASPTQWTWIWENSGRQWGRGRHGMLQFMGSQRVKHDLVTEQQHMPLSWDYFTYLKHICGILKIITWCSTCI